MSQDQSCRDTVARVIADRLLRREAACSANTSSYCKARGRLEESFLAELTRDTARDLEQQAPLDWLWNNKRVKLIDGSSVSMPDTEENQAEYPQWVNHHPGVGFPLARIVAVISLATGAVIDFSMGPYYGKKTGEHALLREILSCFQKGDVALADSYYCS